MPARNDIARSAATRLTESIDALKNLPVVVGFDGFIDSIIHPVEKRQSLGPDGYIPFRTIEQFSRRVAAAAGKSANIELVVKEDRFGGNGPLMAGAMGRAGAPVTYIGAVGAHDRPRELHPIYADFATRCSQVIAVGPPAHTDALEFDDGKIMLGRPRNVQTICWESLASEIGRERLVSIFRSAALIGIVNWVMMPGVESVWEGIRKEVFSEGRADSKRVFLDLADPTRRSDDDVRAAVRRIADLDAAVPVTLGLNHAEAQRIASVLELSVLDVESGSALGESVRDGAEAIRAAIGIDCVVIHPREGAGAASVDADAAWFDGPFTQTPRLSTGAGDHFNAGFSLGQLAGMTLEECLALGCATSGAYVRDAGSPTAQRLVEFLRELPEPRPR
ncbi:MAG: carbohydrate kinase family protein [Phycisphaeraceae bacterium]|nr:carbohydrate kinase family protein [Phycisphaeraceae bacterium]